MHQGREMMDTVDEKNPSTEHLPLFGKKLEEKKKKKTAAASTAC